MLRGDGEFMNIKILVVAAAIIIAVAGVYDLIVNGGKLFIEYGMSFLPN